MLTEELAGVAAEKEKKRKKTGGRTKMPPQFANKTNEELYGAFP